MRSLAASASFVGLLLAAAACGSHGTDLNQIVNQDPFAEAGGGGGIGGDDGGSVSDPFAGAPGYQSGQVGDTTHNAGKPCTQSGCHSGGGGEADAFLLGGTVYKDYAGTTPAPGVEVRIVDSAGNSATTYSGPQGTFFIGGGKGITFPAIVGVRDGTTTRPMVTPIQSNMTACSQSGCHISGGGGPNSSNYYPIHVP